MLFMKYEYYGKCKGTFKDSQRKFKYMCIIIQALYVIYTWFEDNFSFEIIILTMYPLGLKIITNVVILQFCHTGDNRIL